MRFSPTATVDPTAIPAISRIAGYYRNQIVLLCRSAAPLQRVLAAVRGKGQLAKNERIAVDVDPVSLL